MQHDGLAVAKKKGIIVRVGPAQCCPQLKEERAARDSWRAYMFQHGAEVENLPSQGGSQGGTGSRAAHRSLRKSVLQTFCSLPGRPNMGPVQSTCRCLRNSLLSRSRETERIQLASRDRRSSCSWGDGCCRGRPARVVGGCAGPPRGGSAMPARGDLGWA